MRLAWICLPVLAVFAFAYAEIPPEINYQGYLTRPDGTPLDTVISMTFRIYGNPAGGVSVWTQVQNPCSVRTGLFSVPLFIAGINDPEFQPDSLWLGVTVGNNTEMIPRTHFGSVFSAMLVATLDGAAGGHVQGPVYFDHQLIADTIDCQHGIRFQDGSWQTTAAGGQQVSDTTTWDATRTWVRSMGYLRGANNSISSTGFAGGGNYNRATGNFSTVSGGDSCAAPTINATVGGGWHNTASGGTSTVGGGSNNTASGSFATVGGGVANVASGWAAMVPGGSACSASGGMSFSAGYRARAVHENSFVWADGQDTDYTSDGENSFNVRAFGGVKMYTSATNGARLPAGASAWITISDSTKKADIRPVDTKQVLDKVSQLPIMQWRYKEQSDPTIHHVGPMAQDFWNAFHLGEDSLGISTIDPDGISLAAIQALYAEVIALRTRVQTLEAAQQQGYKEGK